MGKNYRCPDEDGRLRPLIGNSRGLSPIVFWNFIKSLLPPSAAEYYFEGHIIFEISLREISKMMCP
ncbi:MAG: hypothetical protein ACOYOO_12880, partial [Saprospiraceae bacterium]